MSDSDGDSTEKHLETLLTDILLSSESGTETARRPRPEAFHDVKMLSIFRPHDKLLYMHIISRPSEESGPDRYTNVYLTMDHIRYLQVECEKILKENRCYIPHSTGSDRRHRRRPVLLCHQEEATPQQPPGIPAGSSSIALASRDARGLRFPHLRWRPLLRQDAPSAGYRQDGNT